MLGKYWAAVGRRHHNAEGRHGTAG